MTTSGARIALLATATPEWIECRPCQYLGSDAFAEWRRICKEHDAATRRHPETGQWETSVPARRLLPLVEALRLAGFVLEPDDGATVAISRASLAARARASTADARFERVERLSGQALRGYQRQGALWLADRRRALLADEPGVGKTRQAIAALDDHAPLLVVCPAFVKGVWAVELSRTSHRTVEVLAGRGSFRWPQRGQAVVTNYDVLPDIFPAPEEGSVMVLDEAHYLSSYKAQRTKRVRALGQAVRGRDGSTWGLTGTPLQNDPLELWSVLECLDLGFRSFGSWAEFADAFGGRKLPHGGWYWKGPREGVRRTLAGAVLRRSREEVLPELPGKTRRALETSRPDPATDALCADVERRASAAGLWEHPEMLPMLEGFSRAREALAASKVPTLLELVDSSERQGEPLVVFSAHRFAVEVLASRTGWAAITGEVSAAERTRVVERFQAGELRGVAGTIGAMGTGATLTRACHVVFVDRDWTPARNEQAEDRLCRLGQSRGVLVTDLVAPHALDRRVARVLAGKQKMVAGLDALL